MGSPRLYLSPFRATCLLLVLCGARAAPQPAEVLTNSSIVKMVKSGIGAPLIIQMIQTQPGSYVVTPSALITLKQQGVPEAVLSAMLAKQPAKETPAAATPEKPDPASEPVSATGWRIGPVTDPMSDAKTFTAELVTPALVDGAQVGHFKVKATCNPQILTLNIVFISSSNIGFKKNWYGRSAPGGLLGEVAGHDKPWVNMRVRIDQNPPVSVTSEDDYPNEVQIWFTARSTQEAFSAIDEPAGAHPPSRDQQLSDLATLFAASKGAGSIAQLVRAQSLLIELPLANGLTTILQIQPQDPSFRSLLPQCIVSTSPVSAATPESTTPRQALDPTPPWQTPERFEGTSGSFADALPGLMERKLKMVGAETHQFDTETKYIGQLVKACAGITLNMIERVTDRFGHVNFQQLGEDYKLCRGGLTSITPLIRPGAHAGQPLVLLTLPDMALWKSNPTLKSRFNGGGAPYVIKVSISGLHNRKRPEDALPVFVNVVNALLH